MRKFIYISLIIAELSVIDAYQFDGAAAKALHAALQRYSYALKVELGSL